MVSACLKRCLRQVLFPATGAQPAAKPWGISLTIHLYIYDYILSQLFTKKVFLENSSEKAPYGQ
jgi:hypothetical protein